MYTLGLLYRYAKYLCINQKDLNITLEGKLVTAQVKTPNLLYIPQGDSNFLVLDHAARKMFLATSDFSLTEETTVDQAQIDAIGDELRKYFMVFESVLSNAIFALYGSHEDHDEGLL